MKKLILLLFFPVLLRSQQGNNNNQSSPITVDDKMHDAVIYYRACAASLATSILMNRLTKSPLLSALTGIGVGVLQGFVLEKDFAGKAITCLGVNGGIMVFIVHWDLKRKRPSEEAKKLSHPVNID